MNQQEQQDFLLSTFREEVEGHVINLTRGLMSLEEGGSEVGEGHLEQMRELMRLLHTVKGAARMLGFGDITRVAHAMEDVVGYYRNGENGNLPTETVDLLFEGIDTISELVRSITRRGADAPGTPLSHLTQPEQMNSLITMLHTSVGVNSEEATVGASATANGSTPPPVSIVSVPEAVEGLVLPVTVLREPTVNSANGEPVRGADNGRSDETIRVRLDKLDGMINLAGELVINKLQNEEHLEALQGILQLHRQRARLATQLRDFLVEQTPLEERSRLMGMTELFSFAVEEPEYVKAFTNYKSTSSDEKANGSVLSLSAYNLTKNGNGNGNGNSHNNSNSTNGAKNGILDNKAIRKIYDKLEELLNFDRQLDRSLTDMLRERKRYNLGFETAATELRRNMLSIRMLPLDNLFSRFARPVRDLANERGKQVRFNISGGTVEIDKRVLEEISDPLQHILRNAVDHGLESPAERLAAGKSAEGNLTLSATQRGSHVYIQVVDDGRGLNPDILRRVAVTKGILSQFDAQILSDEDALDLIFRAGFSTRLQADEISGRGVGLDIVQQNVKRLNGRISVIAEVGVGTSFTLEIPLTLATVDALLVKSAGQLFAIPSVMVESSLRPHRSEIVEIDGRPAIRHRDQLVPVVNMAAMLGLNAVESDEDSEFSDVDEDRFHAVLLSASVGSTGVGDKGQERYICFEVEALVDEREVVVKGLPRFLENVHNVAGVTILGADGLALILDVFGLVQTARQGGPANLVAFTPTAYTEALPVQRARRILIVDDSLATRELERSILETAGYKVETARDGVEALQIARQHSFDLVLSDVEMPNMDGIGLCSAIRQDEKLNRLPVIIVSSRDSDEDRRRGLQAGAHAYIVKSQFEQNKLLETIARLIV